MSSFKPLLAPDDKVDLSKLEYPILASYKYDGIRCIFKNGEMLSRNMKPIANIKLHEKFKALKEFSKEEGFILDGEIYTHELNFPELSGLCRRLEAEVPESMKFYCFDILDEGMMEDVYFIVRYTMMKKYIARFQDIALPVLHATLESPEHVESYFEKALEDGYEGLMLRNAKGRYKFGRATYKEGIIYKMKPYITFDAPIVEVEQGTVVDPSAEKKVNELGYSETSQKKGDRLLAEKAKAFVVMHEGKPLHVMIAATMEEKEEIWKNKEKYIGRWIEYKGLLVGSKDVPRHPVFLRYRDDKEKIDGSN